MVADRDSVVETMMAERERAVAQRKRAVAERDRAVADNVAIRHRKTEEIESKSVYIHVCAQYIIMHAVCWV